MSTAAAIEADGNVNETVGHRQIHSYWWVWGLARRAWGGNTEEGDDMAKGSYVRIDSVEHLQHQEQILERQEIRFNSEEVEGAHSSEAGRYINTNKQQNQLPSGEPSQLLPTATAWADVNFLGGSADHDGDGGNLRGSDDSLIGSIAVRASEAVARAVRCFWDCGVACISVAAVVFAFSILLVKLAAERVPVLEIALVRSALSWTATVGILRWRDGGTQRGAEGDGALVSILGHRANYPKLFARGVFGASSMIAHYVSLTLLPMADAVTLFYAYPPLAALLAWAVCGEALGPQALVGCGLSMAGVVLLTHPPFLFGGHAAWGAARLVGTALGLLSAMLCAGSLIAIRLIGRTEPALVVAIYFHTVTLLVSTLPLALGWPRAAVLPGRAEVGLLLGIAATSFVGQLLVTRALQVAAAAKMSAINFTQVVYSHILGIIFFSTKPTALGLVGSLLVACGVMAVNLPSLHWGGAESETVHGGDAVCGDGAKDVELHRGGSLCGVERVAADASYCDEQPLLEALDAGRSQQLPTSVHVNVDCSSS